MERKIERKIIWSIGGWLFLNILISFLYLIPEIRNNSINYFSKLNDVQLRGTLTIIDSIANVVGVFSLFQFVLLLLLIKVNKDLIELSQLSMVSKVIITIIFVVNIFTVDFVGLLLMVLFLVIYFARNRAIKKKGSI